MITPAAAGAHPLIFLENANSEKVALDPPSRAWPIYRPSFVQTRKSIFEDP